MNIIIKAQKLLTKLGKCGMLISTQIYFIIMTNISHQSPGTNVSHWDRTDPVNHWEQGLRMGRLAQIVATQEFLLRRASEHTGIMSRACVEVNQELSDNEGSVKEIFCTIISQHRPRPIEVESVVESIRDIISSEEDPENAAKKVLFELQKRGLIT